MVSTKSLSSTTVISIDEFLKQAFVTSRPRLTREKNSSQCHNCDVHNKASLSFLLPSLYQRFISVSTDVHAFPHLAVLNEISDTASEVLVLQLWVDIRQVLIHSSQLKHLCHVQMPESTSEDVVSLATFASLPHELLMCCMLWRGHFSLKINSDNSFDLLD